MPRIVVSFKNTKEELELYEAIQKHSCPSAYVKDFLNGRMASMGIYAVPIEAGDGKKGEEITQPAVKPSKPKAEHKTAKSKTTKSKKENPKAKDVHKLEEAHNEIAVTETKDKLNNKQSEQTEVKIELNEVKPSDVKLENNITPPHRTLNNQEVEQNDIENIKQGIDHLPKKTNDLLNHETVRVTDDNIDQPEIKNKSTKKLEEIKEEPKKEKNKAEAKPKSKFQSLEDMLNDDNADDDDSFLMNQFKGLKFED